MSAPSADEHTALKQQIRALAQDLGFQALGVASVALEHDAERLRDWIARGWHGQMAYMERHGAKRWTPAESACCRRGWTTGLPKALTRYRYWTSENLAMSRAMRWGGITTS